MSVLLEALKKAAEDKKKALESSAGTKDDDLSQKEEPVSTSNVLEKGLNKEKSDISLQEITEESHMKVELSLDTTPVTENLKNSDDEASSPPSELDVSEVQQASLSLKLDSSPIIKPKDLKPKSDLDDDKEVIDAPISSSLKLVVDDINLTKAVSNNNEELSLQQNMANIKEAKQKEPKLNLSLSEPSLTENIQEPLSQTHQNQQESNLSLVDEEPFLIKQEQQEHVEASSVVLSDEASLKEAELRSEEDPKTKVPDLEAVKEEQTPIEPSSLSNVDKKLKEDEESYKWSLDSLPGYLRFGKKSCRKSKNNSEKSLNPILVSGALSEAPPKEKSFKLAFILLIFLFVIGIFFYGVFYYQTQYESLEQRMNKYNLTKTPIMVKKVTQVDEKDSQVQVTAVNGDIKEIDSDKTEGTVLEKAPSLDSHSSTVENKETFPQETPIKKAIVVPKPEVIENTLKEKIQHVVDVPRSFNKNSPNQLNRVQNTTKTVVVVHSEEDILSEAYLSYEKGNLVQAQTDFERVLNMNPQNEFALIGLGNIFTSKQQYIDAMAYYQQALSAHPSSLHAFEAIANISGHVDLNREWKSALLNMLQDHPKSSTLQYALGNLYATEQDWLAAQDAYFQAVALEPDNADYLVNLAVSLDQLGKYKSAARYYTEALAFVDVQPVNFNEVQVKNRLISIRQFMAGRNQ